MSEVPLLDKKTSSSDKVSSSSKKNTPTLVILF